ncbi:DOPA 4,5-dioxygenase family protein [Pseudoalteromonas sp. SMS1]|uniref:DOPA 4,5-dioxygenase family protein n=1 Tax=Pseudoalteromonas sp. SMS1 TaxID=2908894 RepID=UPI001F1B4CAC|nr:DOPA 4,5-dioxygenase family protein [Pseudoalteromonas sp. SMS1]MCF2860151.1 DOPA 4,5-dioxygenase family protein [Pseudoalteromonas sp. SMS1]
MLETKKPVNNHKAYHAHVYFDMSSSAVAKKLCEEIAHSFDLKVGRFHERLVGPHPCWSCQISFFAKDFEQFVPWLDVKRQNLTVFVHALTGNDYLDHTEFAYWLGEPVELDLSLFS